MSPEQRAERARLFLVPFPTTSAQGTPLITTLIAQQGTATASRELAKVLRDAANGDVDFGGPAQEWAFIRQAIGQLLDYARADIANRPVHLRRVGLERIFGGVAWMWAGVRPQDVDLVAANFIRIHAPELLKSVPEDVRVELGARPPVPEHEGRPTEERERPERGGPRIEVIPPTGPSRDQLSAEAGLLWTRTSIGVRLAILQQLFDIPPATSAVYADRPFERLPAFVRTALRLNLTEAQQLERIARREAPAPHVPSTLPPQPAPPPVKTHVPEPSAPSQPKQGVSLAQRYRPCRLKDIFDEVRAINQLRGIVRSGVVGGRGAAIILWGPTGTGKTTGAQAFARDYLINHGALTATTENPCPQLPAEFFTKITKERLPLDPGLAAQTLNAILQTTITAGTLTELRGVKRVILVDDFANLPASVIERLKPLLENYTGNAVVIITMNPNPGRVFNDDQGKALLSRSQVVEFSKIPSDLIAKRLHQIADAEHFTFPDIDAAIQEASVAANGDLGEAIGRLQAAYNQFLGSSEEL